MLLRNPNLYADINQAIKYFGLPTDRNVNFRLPTRLEFKQRKFLLQSINGINHAIVNFDTNLIVTTILLMLNYVNDEPITPDYYIVPFEQTVNLFDNYDVLGLAFDRCGFALDLFKRGNKQVLQKPILLRYKTNYMVNKDLSPLVYYGSLPLAYYTLSVINCIANNQFETDMDLMIGILTIYLLYDYSYQILQEASIPRFKLKNVEQLYSIPDIYLNTRNQVVQLLANHQI